MATDDDDDMMLHGTPSSGTLAQIGGGVGLKSEGITWVGLGGFLVAWLLGCLDAWLAADAKRSLKCFQCKRKGIS